MYILTNTSILPSLHPVHATPCQRQPPLKCSLQPLKVPPNLGPLSKRCQSRRAAGFSGTSTQGTTTATGTDTRTTTTFLGMGMVTTTTTTRRRGLWLQRRVEVRNNRLNFNAERVPMMLLFSSVVNPGPQPGEMSGSFRGPYNTFYSAGTLCTDIVRRGVSFVLVFLKPGRRLCCGFRRHRRSRVEWKKGAFVCGPIQTLVGALVQFLKHNYFSICVGMQHPARMQAEI